jgi:hypothetical protein
MSGAPVSLLWSIVIIVIVLIVIIVLLKLVFAVIAIGPIAIVSNAYAAGEPIDYGPNGIPVVVWPNGIANGPPTTPTFNDPAGLVPGGPGWGFFYSIIP